jgi:hypothetical protein
MAIDRSSRRIALRGGRAAVNRRSAAQSRDRDRWRNWPRDTKALCEPTSRKERPESLVQVTYGWMFDRKPD